MNPYSPFYTNRVYNVSEIVYCNNQSIKFLVNTREMLKNQLSKWNQSVVYLVYKYLTEMLSPDMSLDALKEAIILSLLHRPLQSTAKCAKVSDSTTSGSEDCSADTRSQKKQKVSFLPTVPLPFPPSHSFTVCLPARAFPTLTIPLSGSISTHTHITHLTHTSHTHLTHTHTH